MTDPAMPPTVPLVYRTSPNGRVRAAYLGNCRVGYVEHRETTGRWMWQSIFLQPTGGAYLGKEDDEDSAKMMLEMSVYHWITEAGLSPPASKETKNATIEPTDHREDRATEGRDEREHHDSRSTDSQHRTGPRRGPAAKSQRARKAR